MSTPPAHGITLAIEVALVSAVVVLVSGAVACLAAFAPEPVNLLSVPALVLLAGTARLLAGAAWPHALAVQARRSRH